MTFDARKPANKSYYRAIAYILNLANRNENYRRDTFWPVIEEASITCGDRVALSILHLDVKRQIIDFDKRNLAGFADLLCRGVWALSLLEMIAREKIPTLRFFDEIEVYLAYPIKLKETLDLPICLRDMLYFEHWSGLKQSDLESAKEIVQEQLANEEARLDFLLTQDDWTHALAANYPEEIEKINNNHLDSGQISLYNGERRELTRQAISSSVSLEAARH